MSKYKLIKEYPGSPKLGHIVTFKKGFDYVSPTTAESGKCNQLVKGYIENQPEFWQKIPEFPIIKDSDFKIGDICWRVSEETKDVTFGNIFYSNWCKSRDNIGDNSVKYFSNEKNARTYYNQLKWQDKLKFKVGDKIERINNSNGYMEISGIDYLNEKYTYKPHFLLSFSDEKYWQIYQEKTPEQVANELGYKVGDKIWSNKSREYLGTIKGFHYDTTKKLIAEVGTWNPVINSKNKFVTNKVAIHTPTLEDFEFIKSKVGFTRCEWDDFGFNSYYAALCINENKYTHSSKALGSYLILSVDDYCKAMNIEPLFITEDGKNIYEGMNYFIAENNRIQFIPNATKDSGKQQHVKYFSTQQAAQDYLDSLKPKYVRWIDNLGAKKFGLMVDGDKFQKGKIFDTSSESITICCEDWNEILSDKWYSFNFEEVSKKEYLESLKLKLYLGKEEVWIDNKHICTSRGRVSVKEFMKIYQLIFMSETIDRYATKNYDKTNFTFEVKKDKDIYSIGCIEGITLEQIEAIIKAINNENRNAK